MARSGTSLGTVIRWEEEQHRGLIEAPDLPDACWVDAETVQRDTGRGGLRSGQVVEFDWTESGFSDAPLRATRVLPRPDLQTGLGG